MAVWKVVESNNLSGGLVLAPERYHPRRELVADRGAMRIADVAEHVRETVTPERAARSEGTYRVLDTSDVVEGRVGGSVPTRDGKALGSAKKLLRPGDVVVSRLRPYLRQVGYVDDALFATVAGDACRVACSTEFLVLRSKDGTPLAFLVPLLLSDRVQDVFASAVEGGHHPRFAPEVLMGLPIPDTWLARRTEVSEDVASAVRGARVSEASMAAAIVDAARSFEMASGT